MASAGRVANTAERPCTSSAQMRHAPGQLNGQCGRSMAKDTEGATRWSALRPAQRSARSPEHFTSEHAFECLRGVGGKKKGGQKAEKRATAQKGATEGRAMGKLDVVLKQHAELRQEGVSTVSPRVHEEEEEENVAQKSDIPMAGQRKLQGLKGY